MVFLGPEVELLRPSSLEGYYDQGCLLIGRNFYLAKIDAPCKRISAWPISKYCPEKKNICCQEYRRARRGGGTWKALQGRYFPGNHLGLPSRPSGHLKGTLTTKSPTPPTRYTSSWSISVILLSLLLISQNLVCLRHLSIHGLHQRKVGKILYLLKLFGSIRVVFIGVRVIFLGELVIRLLYLLLTRIPDVVCDALRCIKIEQLFEILTWTHPMWNKSQVLEAY